MAKFYLCKQDKPCAKGHGCKKNGGPCAMTSSREHAVTTKAFLVHPERKMLVRPDERT